MNLNHSLAVAFALQLFSLAVHAQTAESLRSSSTLAGLAWTLVPILLIGILMLWIMRSKWKTWAPFQSPDVREICAHMTEDEERAASRKAALHGLWCGVTLTAVYAAVVVVQTPAILVIAPVMIIIHLGWLRVWLRSQRRFYCSTSWARERGLTPERLRLFAFSR